MATAAEKAREFLAGVLAKLPEEQRAQAEAVFNHAAATQALDELGAGVLRQADYSRSMDDVRTAQQRAQALYDQNNQWWQANSAEVAEAERLRAELATLQANGHATPPTPPATPPVQGQPPSTGPKYATVEDLQATARDALALFATVPTLSLRHRDTFGEILPLADLIAEAQTKRISLDDAYSQRYAAQLKTKADERQAAEITRIKNEGIAEYRAANPQMAYPIPGRSTGTSPLDAIKPGAPVEPNANLVDEATAEYHRLVEARAGA